MKEKSFPELPLAEWQETLTTLHMWSQIVGKMSRSQKRRSSIIFGMRPSA